MSPSPRESNTCWNPCGSSSQANWTESDQRSFPGFCRDTAIAAAASQLREHSGCVGSQSRQSLCLHAELQSPQSAQLPLMRLQRCTVYCFSGQTLWPCPGVTALRTQQKQQLSTGTSQHSISSALFPFQCESFWIRLRDFSGEPLSTLQRIRCSSRGCLVTGLLYA